MLKINKIENINLTDIKFRNGNIIVNDVIIDTISLKLSDIIKIEGVFANDIRTRFKNNQISINNEVVKDNLTINLTKITEAGVWIANNISKNPIWIQRCKLFGFENLFDSNIENDLTNFLKSFKLLKISKIEMFILQL